MPQIFVIDRFYMDRMFEAGEQYPISEATLQDLKDKGMTHHFQRTDKADAEVKKAAEEQLEKMTMPDLREKAENLGIEYGKMKKAELVEAIRQAVAGAA